MDENSAGQIPKKNAAPSAERQAAEWFLLRRRRRLTAPEREALENWLAESADHAAAWRDTQQIWDGFGEHAMLPELVVARREALSAVRHAQLQRWNRTAPRRLREALRSILPRPRAWAAATAAAAALVTVWWLNPTNGEVYRTDIGEQRTVWLEDRSRMALDALTRVRVRYERDARTVEVVEGQVRFDVAPQRDRPFRVRAGSRVIEALGTVFTVEYIKQEVRVALLEGRIVVAQAPSSWPAPPSPSKTAKASASARGVELAPGQALRIEPNGRQALDTHADLAAATAWQQGKVIFEQEPLRDAVERLNRYSRVQIKIADPSIEHWPVSGIFGSGDAETFAEALASYFPIQIQRAGPDAIELRRRP